MELPCSPLPFFSNISFKIIIRNYSITCTIMLWVHTGCTLLKHECACVMVLYILSLSRCATIIYVILDATCSGTISWFSLFNHTITSIMLVIQHQMPPGKCFLLHHFCYLSLTCFLYVNDWCFLIFNVALLSKWRSPRVWWLNIACHGKRVMEHLNGKWCI
jgi:hypothetical protein